MNLRFTRTILLVTILIFALPSQAQIVIGSNETPVKGALLQVKDKTGVTDDSENAAKGIVFPRVRLEQKNQLYPMLKNDPDYPGNKAAIDKQHTGMLVYNTYESPSSVTDKNLIFKKGVYVWTGADWCSIAESNRVSNGLTFADEQVMWGGSLTENTTITADNKNLIFDLKNVPAVRTRGLMIKGLTEQAHSVALVADAETGKVGLSPVIPAKLAFIQSGTETRNPSAINQAGVGYWVVPWSAADVVTNNGVVEFNPADNSWTMTLNAMVELSGMVGYIGRSGTGMVVINSTIQIKKASGPDAGVWKDYSSVRGVYQGTVNAYRNTLNIPPAMADLKEGDAIRLILARAPDMDHPGTAFLGDPHLVGGAPQPSNGVVRPYGTQFSKMLKIIVQ
ncbi:MAG: hypothetical protein LBH80_07430 [Prevotellaceae bacterium]|jgi:hypothetical protein|nr:hypothetical protein [Prevotellaceae bacterium]